jgi:hypothetical protein
MPDSELLKRKAEWAERKCDEASASGAPWALANLRVYQYYAFKFWGEYYASQRTNHVPTLHTEEQ